MKIETLIEICRSGELKNYGPDLSIWGDDWDIKNVDKSIVNQYELINDSVEVDGSAGYLNDVNAVFIIKNKLTGKFYKVKTGHDSWTDSMLESFDNVKISEVNEVEVTVTEYEHVTTIDVDDL